MIVAQLAVSAFSALRVFALSGRNKPLSAVTFILWATPSLYTLVVLGQANFISLPGPHSGSSSCAWLNNLGDGILDILLMATYISTSLAELMVIIVTWKSTYRLWRAQRDLGLPCRLTTVLLRDGSIYFMLVFIPNILNLIAYVLPPLFPNSDWIVYLIMQEFINISDETMNYIIISRLILNLRRADHQMALGQSMGPLSQPDFGLPSKDHGPGWLASIGGPVYSGFVDSDSESDLDDSSEDVDPAADTTPPNDVEGFQVEVTHANGIVVEDR
ncbi:hypothetical protein L226DRAFT_537294 [Lentinus tigrinus ALCF2SS1-7]|uniref:uncharacterized protein n=1 Tax=Lentinus tigrinus ALCF2SS1-7 TaxID=1328758 RepID=UPI001165CC62|nr:hypothetical protein L226DRAFT_537294 [Lentinus tigrinus ALCF2SS1-7]